MGSIRDVDDNEFPGISDAGDLKVLEEEADSVSNEDSTANSSDNEDHQIDTVEEVRRSPEPRLGLLTMRFALLCVSWPNAILIKIDLIFSLSKSVICMQGLNIPTLNCAFTCWDVIRNWFHICSF